MPSLLALVCQALQACQEAAALVTSSKPAACSIVVVGKLQQCGFLLRIACGDRIAHGLVHPCMNLLGGRLHAILEAHDIVKLCCHGIRAANVGPDWSDSSDTLQQACGVHPRILGKLILHSLQVFICNDPGQPLVEAANLQAGALRGDRLLPLVRVLCEREERLQLGLIVKCLAAGLHLFVIELPEGIGEAALECLHAGHRRPKRL
mmetsp:Transcript_81056/g.229532  ORF Transcript_81056/g.229532 Transcript_81056/m.229532 type:complete len:206 (+) Transcript_81056:186-803(+)